MRGVDPRIPTICAPCTSIAMAATSPAMTGEMFGPRPVPRLGGKVAGPPNRVSFYAQVAKLRPVPVPAGVR